MRLAQIETGRADEVADVLDEQQRPVLRCQMLDRVADHVCIEMTALAGVDLDRRRAGRADAVGVVGCLLVALDDMDSQPITQHLDGLHQQRGLAGSGAGDEVQRQNAVSGRGRRGFRRHRRCSWQGCPVPAGSIRLSPVAWSCSWPWWWWPSGPCPCCPPSIRASWPPHPHVLHIRSPPVPECEVLRRS